MATDEFGIPQLPLYWSYNTDLKYPLKLSLASGEQIELANYSSHHALVRGIFHQNKTLEGLSHLFTVVS